MSLLRIHFLLVAEGSSDDALIPHLETLCIDQGATEVTGTAPDFERLPESIGHTVQAKLAAAIQLEPSANLIFIHRDADTRDPKPRYDEIAGAMAANPFRGEHVALVPVQATEAWLLADEHAIRRAAYRPNGTRPLGLPAASHIERTANPKQVLKTALVSASELAGRRLDRIKREFPAQRRLLFLQLPIQGAIEALPSWQRLRTDLGRAIGTLRTSDPL